MNYPENIELNEKWITKANTSQNIRCANQHTSRYNSITFIFVATFPATSTILSLNQIFKMGFNIIKIDKGILADIEKAGVSLNQTGLTKWLKTKNLISDNEILKCFNDIQPWQRTGGETYSTIFSFKTDIHEHTIVVKAIVTTNPEKSLIDWTNRRAILARNNISVSNWYWTGNATIYEPFYPDKSDNTNDFSVLIQTAFILDSLGFTTLKFLDDILCDKSGNPFYIDFGFDLGEPSQTIKTTAKEHLTRTYPNRKDEIEAFYNTDS